MFSFDDVIMAVSNITVAQNTIQKGADHFDIIQLVVIELLDLKFEVQHEIHINWHQTCFGLYMCNPRNVP